MPEVSSEFQSAFDDIRKLVTEFEAQEAHFLSLEYGETEVRNDFIDRFFIALGWDVKHDTQKNPYAQEVKVEKSVRDHGKSERQTMLFLFYRIRETKSFL